MNAVYFLGTDLVLRIPRDCFEETDLLAKESAVLPVVARAGVCTPELVEYDSSCEIVDRPYQLVARVEGTDLHALAIPPPEPVGVYEATGRVLARLHTISYRNAPTFTAIPIDKPLDPGRVVDQLATDELVNSTQAQWLIAWLDRLDTFRPKGSDLVLTHGDVTPSNLLAQIPSLRFAAIIDWGDAAWADRSRDFADLPIRSIPAVLRGYREQLATIDSSSTHTDLSLEAGALWYQVSLMLIKTVQTDTQPDTHVWSAPRLARLFELVQFLAGHSEKPWSTLMPC